MLRTRLDNVKLVRLICKLARHMQFFSNFFGP